MNYDLIYIAVDGKRCSDLATGPQIINFRADNFPTAVHGHYRFNSTCAENLENFAVAARAFTRDCRSNSVSSRQRVSGQNSAEELDRGEGCKQRYCHRPHPYRHVSRHHVDGGLQPGNL